MIPVKIKALNQDSSDESNVEDEENPITKEALEQKLQFGYREALLLQKQNKLKEAENILLQLIKSDVLNNAHGKVKYVNGRVQPSIFHLKYCCFLNLGNISFKMDRYELALKYYALATELDDTDLNLWYKIGNVAMKIPNLMFAVCAFTETLYRNPHHWPSLNSIITATYALGDMMACLLYIHQALSLDNGYRKGSILKERIFKEHPHIKEDFYSLYPQVDERIPIEFDNEEAYKCFREIDDLKVRDRKLSSTLYGVTNQEIPIRGLLKPLKHNSWICLGKSLLKLYKYLYNVDSNDMIFFSKINMKSSSSCNDSNKEAVSSVISFATESITSAAIIEENVLCELSDENHHQEKNTVPPSDHENCTVSNTIDSNNKEDKDRNVGSCKNEEENAGSNELDQDEDNIIDDDDDNVHNNNHDDNDDDNDDENNDDGDDDDDGGDDEDDDDNEGEILKELNASSSKIEDTEKCVLETNNRTKRRKCSPTLADQLKLCDKRRSTRNKTVLKSNEPSLSKVLKNLIPSDLLPQKKTICKSSYFELMRWNDDSFDTMDIYRLLFEHQDQNNLPSYPVNEVTEQSRNKMLLEEKYFGSEKEKSDVEWYINMYNEQPLLELIEAYLRELARKWSIIWPAFLTSIFLEMCRILQKHGKVLQIFCKSEMNAFNEESLKLLKDNLLLVLMFGELSLDDYFVDADKGQPLSGSIFGGHFSSLLLGEMRDACSILNVIETDVKLWMRTCWLEAMLFLQKKNSYAASSALSMIVEDITDSDIEIRLPNLHQFYLISQSNARRLLNTLIRNEDLNRVKYLIADEQFNRVIEILENTLKPDCQQLIQIPNEITLSRYQQYTILLDALSEAKRYEELFKWCEVCCYESFAVYRKSFFDEIDTDMKSKWASLVMKTLNGMLWCFKNVGQTILNTLNQEDLVRLVQTFCSLICHQIEASDPIPEITTSTVAPWILLCNIVRFHEKNRDIANEDDNVSAEVFVSPSMSLLFVAHEYLGKRCWCCFDDGALLFYTLDVIEDMYKQSVLFSETWQTLAQQIDQIFYCLYAHPFKRNKPRYVQEHNSLGLALTWNRAVQAYCFYRPVQLPMFDAVSKQYTISADTETLLKRMIPLIPPEHNPGRFLDCANQLTNNVVDDIAIDENALQSEVADIFYLLGDYYFKNKIMNKAIKYYLLDVRFNRQRFDSWAAMALARGSQLETKLNSCETIKNESDILKKADLTDKCYKTALELDTNQPTLWIEYGVFCYSIHGFCSRLLKQETTTLSLQMFDTLENRKNELLKMSFKCFNAANDAWIEMTKRQMDIQDERWLHHYMLGKIAEKNEEKISVYMNHYLKASELLHQNGAQYPSRILYSSPQYYSVEALEIYYRIHATILKFLEAHEEKPLDESVIDVLLDVTGQLSECAFVKAVSSRSDNGGNGKCSENLSCERRAETTEDKKNEETAQNVENDVRQILEETLALIVDNESDKSMPIKRKLSADLDLSDISSTTKKLRVEGDKTELEYFHNEELIKKGFSTKTTDIDTPDVTSSTCENKDESFQSNKTETTIKQNNAHALLTDKCIAALEECVRRFPEHYKSYYRLANHYFRSKKYKHIEKARKYLLEDGGLFADRKASNFFSGIWRIPTGEIDRSGSFAFHMSRSVHLLVDVLRDTQDFKMLLNLSMQLRDMPELDKKYIRDNEREQICKEALSLSVQTLRKHIDNLSPTENEETKRKLLLEVYKCHQRMSRFYTQKDAPFGKLLQSVFCKYTNRKDKVNLEQIVSFCRSLNSASKETLSTTLLSFQFKDNCKMISSKSNDVPAKLQALNFAMTSDTKAHSNGNARKGSNDGRANHNNVLPNNLKNLPSAITVTTVPKNKNPATTNSQGSLWNKFKANKDLDLKLKFAPPFAHSSCEEERKLKMDSKSKFNPMSKAMLVDASNASNASKISRPYVKVTKPYCKEKTNSKMKCLPSSDKSIIEESASTIISDKGLTITPVMSKDTKSGGTSATHTISKFFASEMKNTPVTSNKCSSNSVKVDVSFSASERQGLFITPVVDKTKNQPTLQQKLAAKQLANVGPALKNSSAPKYANVINTTTAFDISKNLGSSGVSIFPLPLSDANSSGVALIGSRSSSNAVNTTVSSSAAAFQSQQSAVFISHVSASSSSSPSPSPSTSSKKYASSMVENSQKPKSKPSETAEVLDCKHYNKNIMPDSGDSRKRSDEKLKNVLKALEESSNIIITPKSSNKPEQPEVIILE